MAGEGDDDEFAALLDRYLDPPAEPNRKLNRSSDVTEIVWVEADERLGAAHIEGHGINKREVEEVLLEIPPYVEAKRSPDHPERTLFWGATRRDRWIFVVCEDWREGRVRYLKPIRAFEPDDGEGYWRRQ